MADDILPKNQHENKDLIRHQKALLGSFLIVEIYIYA